MTGSGHKNMDKYVYIVHTFIPIIYYNRSRCAVEINNAFLSKKYGGRSSMKHKVLLLTGIGVVVAGAYFLKSIGWFEDDSHLYDEYEAK
jgi:hypothetical protein